MYYIYFLTYKRGGGLYTGVTNNLVRRIYEHKNSLVRGFSKRYSLKLLVYYEVFDNIQEAITREKRLKKWNRAWKIELIEKDNPNWKDLYDDIAN